MTQANENTNATPTPPNATQVAGHLTMVQWISLLASIVGAIVTVVQPMLSLPQYEGIAWMPPVVTILAAMVAAATAWVKAYNVPTLLLASCFLLLAYGLSGCAQTETNRVAQSMIATTAQAKTALTLHNAGITTPAQEAVIARMLKAEATAEDAYYAAIEAGDSSALATAKAVWATAAAELAAELAKYPVPATTQAATKTGT
jgi:hypothetical protein